MVQLSKTLSYPISFKVTLQFEGEYLALQTMHGMASNMTSRGFVSDRRGFLCLHVRVLTVDHRNTESVKWYRRPQVG